jgi:hypothetical protein
MRNAPIYGSQINTPAKLYKRFTGKLPVELKDGEVITTEDNRYVCYFRFAWVDADDMQSTEQPGSGGAILHTYDLSIKFYGRWKPKEGSVDEPEAGDILQIDNEFWIIEEGVQRARKKSLVNFATVFLPLRKLI